MERADSARLDESPGARGEAAVRLESRHRHAPGRGRAVPAAQCAAARPDLTGGNDATAEGHCRLARRAVAADPPSGSDALTEPSEAAGVDGVDDLGVVD